MEKEIWKTTIESDLYEVSNLGKVRHIIRRKILVTDKNHSSGYCYWTRREDKTYNSYVHRTVYQAFNNIVIPKGMEINHLDFNRKNNCLSNLELVNKKENHNYSFKAGRYEDAHKKQSEMLKNKWASGWKLELSSLAKENIGKKTKERIKTKGHHNLGKFGLDNPAFKWTIEQLEEVRNLWKSGRSMNGIAKELNKPYTSIRNVCVGPHKDIM
jgi:hypothetical protein